MNFDTVQSYLFLMRWKRSGSALVSTLIDAHPNAICPRVELLFSNYKKHGTREKVLDHVWTRSKKYRSRPFAANGYRYPIEGAGRCETPIVIGHKSSTRAFLPLSKDLRVLKDFCEFVKLPPKFLFLIRNPANMTAARWMQKEFRRKNAPVGAIIDEIEKVAACHNKIWTEWKAKGLEVRLEDLINQPIIWLSLIEDFLELPESSEWKRECKKLIFTKDETHTTEPPWTTQDKDRINKLIGTYEFFKGYKEIK